MTGINFGRRPRGVVEAPAIWPFELPVSGSIGRVGTNTLADVAAADSAERLHLSKVLGAWGSGAVSLIKDESGDVVDVWYWIFGGGHGDTGWDGLARWSAATGLFDQLLAPTKWAPAPTPILPEGEVTFGRPESQHVYQNLRGMDSDESPLGPSFMQLRGSAVGQGANISGQSHRYVVGSGWARIAGLQTTVPSIHVCGFVKDTLRKRFVKYGSNNASTHEILPYDTGSPEWVAGSGAARDYGWSDINNALLIYDPVRDLYIGGMMEFGEVFRAIPAATPGAAWTALNHTGTVPTNIRGTGWQYRSATDTFVMMDTAQTPPVAIYEIAPPANPANWAVDPWVWTRRVFSGTSLFVNAVATSWYDRWQYVEVFDAIISPPVVDQPMEMWRL